MAKAPKRPTNEPIHCATCQHDYPRKELRRTTHHFPGIRRTSGSPTGARTTYFLCCPKGHQVATLGFKVS